MLDFTRLTYIIFYKAYVMWLYDVKNLKVQQQGTTEITHGCCRYVKFPRSSINDSHLKPILKPRIRIEMLLIG